MGPTNETPARLTLAIESTANLWREGFGEFTRQSHSQAQFAHTQIESLPINQRAARFYSVLTPLLQALVTIFVATYRRFFKLANANPRECGSDPHDWACYQLQGGMTPVSQWIQDWYALACDGENQYIQRVASIQFVPGDSVSASIPMSSSSSFGAKSWRSPAWLFVVSPLMGFHPLKSKNLPGVDSDQRLSVAHTRLLLKGMRRVFLWKLKGEIETARNEEIAAAGAVVASVGPEQVSSTQRRDEKRQPRGFEGLRHKLFDLSRYMDGLTDKQSMAFSLKCEYGRGPTEIASRMRIDRKTVDEHLEAADKKIKERHSNERRKAQNPRDVSE
jgi:hypothetical protein